MRKIRDLLIVGLGSIGSRHLKIISDLRPEINIYVLRRPGYRKSNLDHLIKKVYTNIDDAIKFGFDAAIIASPSSFHIDQATKFVEKKIPILIEKPLSNKLEDSLKFSKIAKANNSIILVGYVLRYTSILQRFREIILKESFEKINSIHIKCSSFLPNWRLNKNYKETVSAKKSLGGGVLLELSHEIDYANWIFGPLTILKSETFNSGKLNVDVEDEVKILAKSNKCLNIKIDLDFHKNENKRFCLVNLENSSIKLDFIKKEIIIKSKKSMKKEFFSEDYYEMYNKQIIHFFSCIERNINPNVTLNDGIFTMELINIAFSSNLNNH